MKIEEFKYLEKEKKKQLLFGNGVYLASRREPEFTIDLYQVDGFYVEAYFYESEDSIGYMKAFTSTDLLAPYINHIDLTQLLKT